MEAETKPSLADYSTMELVDALLGRSDYGVVVVHEKGRSIGGTRGNAQEVYGVLGVLGHQVWDELKPETNIVSSEEV